MFGEAAMGGLTRNPAEGKVNHQTVKTKHQGLRTDRISDKPDSVTAKKLKPA
jgi:hypothetical protein